MGSNCSAEDSLFNAIDQQIHLSWTSELVDCSNLAFPQEVHAQTLNAMKKCSANLPRAQDKFLRCRIYAAGADARRNLSCARLPHGTRFIFQ